MKKDDLVYVGHMLDTARTAMSKVQGLDRAGFDADENLRLALAHLIQIIGEAAARVSDEFRSLHADVPWRSIVGMRHKIVHDYLYVDYDLVWEVATLDLPKLDSQLAPLAGPQ
jgi:uncharacterized protein with HEPN domain